MARSPNKSGGGNEENSDARFLSIAERRVDMTESNSEFESVEMGNMEVHRVVLPPRRSTFDKFKRQSKEIFFPDDPLRQFRGQPSRRKFILGAQYFFPILEWGPSYSFRLLKSDIIAGLTIASLAIPQGISYAKLANLPPIIGLYSSFAPPLIYALLGSSRDLAVGPVSIASLILGAMLSEQVSPTHQQALFLQLAFTSTFFAGLFQASLGVLRLGFLIDFLSKATLIGFMAGSAVIVSLQQLKGLLGIVHFTKKMGIIPVMSSVVHNTNEWSWQTILMGVCFLVLLLLARHISLRNPKLFWVSAGAPLASVIISTVIVYAIKGQKPDISIIGHLERGINPPSWQSLHFKGKYLTLTIKTGLVTGIVSLTETDKFHWAFVLPRDLLHALAHGIFVCVSLRKKREKDSIKTIDFHHVADTQEGIAVGRTFASMKNYKVDGNKEMMAIGLMNMVGSGSSCYITTGAFSRSAVNHNAGAKTAASNIVMSIAVMITLLFLMPLFVYTPNVVLGAIIVSAVIGLIDIPGAYLIWKIDKIDFIVCLCAFLGVIFISVQDGLALAVVISIFKVLLQITRPKVVMLGNISGTEIFRNLHHYKEAKKIPGFLIVAIEAPVNFANTTFLTERISRWIEEEQEDDSGKPVGLHYVILDMSGVSAIDTNGIALLTDLKKTAGNQGLELVLVNPVGEVLEKLQRANQADKFMGVDTLYLTVGEAVFILSSKMKSNAGPNHV